MITFQRSQEHDLFTLSWTRRQRTYRTITLTHFPYGPWQPYSELVYNARASSLPPRVEVISRCAADISDLSNMSRNHWGTISATEVSQSGDSEEEWAGGGRDSKELFVCAVRSASVCLVLLYSSRTAMWYPKMGTALRPQVVHVCIFILVPYSGFFKVPREETER